MPRFKSGTKNASPNKLPDERKAVVSFSNGHKYLPGITNFQLYSINGRGVDDEIEIKKKKEKTKENRIVKPLCRCRNTGRIVQFQPQKIACLSRMKFHF